MSALVFGLLVGMGVAHAPEVAQAVSPSESPAVVVAAPPQGGPSPAITSPSPIGCHGSSVNDTLATTVIVWSAPSTETPLAKNPPSIRRHQF